MRLISRGMPLSHLRFEPDLREQVRGNLESFPRCEMPLQERRPAAVALVVLLDDTARPCFLLTRRAAGLRAHAGQWALPGGHLDPGENAENAALRELSEEMGLALPSNTVLGLLDDYGTRSGFIITPVVVWGGRDTPLAPDPREVAQAHLIPLTELLKPEVPGLRFIPESERPVISIPLLGTLVHAPTAAILYQFREVALRGLATRVAHFEQPLFAWK